MVNLSGADVLLRVFIPEESELVAFELMNPRGVIPNIGETITIEGDNNFFVVANKTISYDEDIIMVELDVEKENFND